jgi:hypothetical protein
LTESQVQALEEAKEDREAHGEMESPYTGFLVAHDTYYVGYIKGVGKLFQQTFLDGLELYRQHVYDNFQGKEAAQYNR